MKIRSLSEFNDTLDESKAWRKKDILELKLQIEKQPKSGILAKSAIVIAYSHWEGYVRDSITAIIEYINAKKVRYNDIRIEIIVFQFLYELKHYMIHTNIDNIIELIRRINTSKRIFINSKTHIRKIKMLTWNEYKKIMQLLGLDIKSLETKQKFIDERLISTRNRIAHGEYENAVDHSLAIETLKLVIEIIEQHHAQVTEYISKKQYRK